jgi:hypothetical protein
MPIRALTFWAIVLVLATTAGTLLYLVKEQAIEAPFTPVESATALQGKIETVDVEAKHFTLLTSQNRRVLVKTDARTDMRNTLGVPADFAALNPDLSVRVIGIAPNSLTLIARSVLITPREQHNDPVKPGNVFEHSLIPRSYAVTGLVDNNWIRKPGYFFVKVYDGKGELLNRAYAYPQGPIVASSTTVTFKAWLWFEPAKTAEGTIVFEQVLPEGSTSTPAKMTIPIRFAEQAGKIGLKLYYPNTRKAAEIGDVCDPKSLLPVVRHVPETMSPIRDSIELLINSQLTADEKIQGFTSEFPHEGFALLDSSLNQKNGTLTLHFTEVPGFTTGGACRVTLLRQQIVETARQFPSVKSVVFLPESLFQP